MLDPCAPAVCEAARKGRLAEDIRYTLARWPGLTRFLGDGRLERDTNPVENQIRKIALTRKNALFAGHEVGAENCAMLASLSANCKMSGVDPVRYLAETLRALLDGQPRSAAHTSLRRHGSLQFRPASQDPRWPHTIRIHLQGLEFRAGSIHPKSDPPDAGTEHLAHPVHRSHHRNHAGRNGLGPG
ncbi:transposase (plasmid) [Ponticoccus alexandrii]|uniref:Transposase n=1 Tax=Ponticoccus alexandrii TaxID=1943633 RepID=A0ABX7FGS8_9RHOB|nr:transposase [Ponticoccus alexandrii]